MEAVCSSETLLPLPTYQTPRLPVPQYIILRACMNFECQVRFAVTLSYCQPVRSCFHLMFPLFPEDGSSMFFRNVVTPTYLPNATASCASKIHNSVCLPELGMPGAIRCFSVLLPTSKALFPSYVSSLSWKWKQYVLPKHCYPYLPTKRHGFLCLNT